MVLVTVLGGLALFLLGMNIMTDGLQKAAGQRLRGVLAHAAHNPVAGVSWGTLLGFLVHSSAATVMMVAFVNAGLLTLVESIPSVIGANIGTTLSMQLISLNISDYAYGVVALGFFLHLLAPHQRVKQAGYALMGFGMIFVGMTTMSDAIRPYRMELQPILSGSDATTVRGMVFGIGVATAVTLVIQSSGATIGMCFALATAGVFSDLAQIYPIVLGAHMGTCITALLGSIGTHIDARRCALSHLVFNVCSVVLAVVLSRPLLWLFTHSSEDLVRQTANMHSGIMVLTALVVLPLCIPFAALVRAVSPSKRIPPEPSKLDLDLLETPEAALYAAILELRRTATIAHQSFRLQAEFMVFAPRRHTMKTIAANEQAINDIKSAMSHYLGRMTTHYLSRRQSILVQHLDRCMVEMERIGDHIQALAQLSLDRMKTPRAVFAPDAFDQLFSLYEQALQILGLVIASLDPEEKDFQQSAARILEARDAYREASYAAHEDFLNRQEVKTETAVAGIYYNRYLAGLDRIVKHTKIIAHAEQQPDFWIKRKKLEQAAKAPITVESRELVDPSDYLARLQSEDSV